MGNESTMDAMSPSLVTGVTETSDGITVKLSDGKSVTISNGKDGGRSPSRSTTRCRIRTT